MMKTTRQRVLEYIRSHKLVTTSDISRGLKMTPENARHHLEILISQGLVEEKGFQIKSTKGRPPILYGISTQVMGHNLDRLAKALLNVLFKTEYSSDYNERLKRIADKLLSQEENINRNNRTNAPPSHLTARLNHAVKLLNIWNYQARWEARVKSPHLFLGNCPYLAILSEHPELCRIDGYLIENLINAPNELVAKRVPDGRGVPFCLFRIRNF